MSPETLPRLLDCALAAWGCLYGPGQIVFAWQGSSPLPPAFARLLFSIIVTTLTGTTLAALGHFSLAAVLAANAALVVLALVTRPAWEGRQNNAPPPPSERIGPVLALLALLAYLPAWPTFLGASDSTAYLGAGVTLARQGGLGREDGLGPILTPTLRSFLFDSMSQTLGNQGPPYRRMPGGVLIESLDAKTAWPSFFPVPAVWSALFVEAGATTQADPVRAAPNYAPFFAAIAVWAFWLLARAWLTLPAALFAVLLLAASAPFYSAARLPTSETVAAAFAMSGLALLACDASRKNRRDQLLAGAALGMAVFTRIEIALFVALALAVGPSLLPARDRASNLPLSPATLASLLLLFALTLGEAALVPGTWFDTFGDAARNALFALAYRTGWSPQMLVVALTAVAVAALAAAAVFSRRGGSALLRWGFVLFVLAGHAMSSNFLWWRTPQWLSFAIGWPALLLAAAGAALAFRDRERLPAGAFVLALLAGVALVLFYNPHVYPTLPWGWRRYVPMLLPLLLLFAAYACQCAAARSRVLALLCAAAIAWPVAVAGKPQWGQDFAEGAYETLERIDAAIPRGGVILVSRGLSPTMLAPALWLVRDRNNLTVPQTDSKAGRDILPWVVDHFLRMGKPVYLVDGGAKQSRVPHLHFRLLGKQAIALRFLEQSSVKTPQTVQRYVLPIAIYQILPSFNPKGDPTP